MHVSAITNIAEVLAEVNLKLVRNVVTVQVESISIPFSPKEVSISTSLNAKDVIKMLSNEDETEVTEPPTKNEIYN